MSEEQYNEVAQGSSKDELQGSKANGLVGALIGAVVGTLPMAILGLIGILSGWLGILAVYGAYKGYMMMDGIRDEKFAKKAIFVPSGICVILTSILIVLFYVVMGEDAANLGGIIIIPFISLGIGYSLIKKKLWVYTNPESYQAYVEQSSEVLEENQDMRFYVPKPKSTVWARVMLLVTFFFTLFASMLGVGALVIDSKQAMVIGGISSCACLVGFTYFIVAVIGVNKASQMVIVKMGESRIFTVHTQKLNQINEYHYSTRSNLVSMNVATLDPNEIQLFQASIMRAIQDIDRGAVDVNAPICKAIVELKSGEVLVDKSHRIKVRYTNRQGGTKQVVLHKIYPQLMLFYGVSMDQGAMQPNYLVCFGLILLNIVLGLASIVGLSFGMYNDNEMLVQLEEQTEITSEKEYEDGGEVRLTDENYQDFNLAADGFDYVTVHYYKAEGAYADAYVPNGKVTYVDDGYGIESILYGIKTYTTMESGYATAEEVVNAYFEEKVAAGMEFDEPDTMQMYYDPDWDIAIMQYFYIEEDEYRVEYLYADTKGEGLYMYSEITYLIEEVTEEADALIRELSEVYAFELPTIFE